MPDYALLTPRDIETGVDHAIARAETVVEGLVDASGERNFENTLRPLDRIGDILAHAFHDFCFMCAHRQGCAVRGQGRRGEGRQVGL